MIIAVVQARMSSERLPGKVLKEVLGKPLIQYLLKRLSLVKKIDKIVLATSIDKANDPLDIFVRQMGVEVYRGSENDVLDRYYQAAKKYQPDAVMRITGDCPLIDPNICDRLISFFQKRQVDYAGLTSRFAEGLDCEVFSFCALEQAWKEACLQSEREHVTLHIKNHKDRFRIIFMDNEQDDSCYRITVDNKEDFEVVRLVLESLKGQMNASWKTVKDFLNTHSHVMRLNAHVERNEGLRKSLEKEQIAENKE